MGSQADGDLLAMMMTGGSQGSSFSLSPASWSWIETSLCYGDISWSLGAFGSLSEDSLKPRLSPAAAKLMSPCPQPRGLGTGWTKSSPAPRISQAPGLEDEEALSARLQGEPTPGPSQELGQAPALEALPSLEEEAEPSEEPSSPELAPAAEESEEAQVSAPPSDEAERLYIPAPKKSPEAQRLFQRLFVNPS